VLVTERGCRGDRAWALRDVQSGRIASAKRFPRLLAFRATYVQEPTPESRGRARIDTPDGRSTFTDDPAASAIISEALGHDLRLESQPRPDEKTGIDRRTVFGDVPVSEMKPDWTPETMPDYFQLKSGSFFEIGGAVFVLTSGSVAHLGRLQGAPGPADRRRFRPNLFLDTGAGSERFVEDEWAARALRVGEDLILSDIADALVRDVDAGPRVTTARPGRAADRCAAPSRLPRRLRVGALAGPSPCRRFGAAALTHAVVRSACTSGRRVAAEGMSS
jgi:uncharacterized protein